jgi:hypothetical protein
MFVTLYIGVVSIIALLFQYINTAFPDLIYYSYTNAYDTMRRSVASLIVVWPVFLAMSVMLAKETVKDPEKRELKIRKWLVYLTLFVSALTLIIDLITLLYNFLGGELSMRFALKVLAILLVAGAVFGYYLWDARRNDAKTKIPKNMAWGTSIVLLIVIVAGFFIMGTPGEQRAHKFDEQRVTHLQNLQYQIIEYWVAKDTLPENLSLLENDILGFSVPTDPQTQEAYTYRTTDTLSFELCAKFNTEQHINSKDLMERGVWYPNMESENWDHDAGEYCYSRTIDPDLYKDRKPTLSPVPTK